MKRFDIMSRAKLWLTICLVFTVLWLSTFFIHLRPSIEFTGWIQTSLQTTKSSEELRTYFTKFMESKWLQDSTISVWENDWYDQILLYAPNFDSVDQNGLGNDLRARIVADGIVSAEENILSFSVNGPSVWEYMTNSALWAIWVWTLFMFIYILFAFSAIRDLLPPVALSVATIVTMLFDISITAWAYGLLMWINPSVQVDTIFVIAILTVLWYSINDKVIIFDRIRENILVHHDKIEKGVLTYYQVFEDSLWQTMRRSIWTWLTTILVLTMMLIFGTPSIQLFSFTMIVWIAVWTYLSIFVAAPMSYLMIKNDKIK